MYILVPFSD